MIKFSNLNNLNEYLKKSEAEQIYMKKINSLNISFTELLTLISQTFSIYDREIGEIKNNTLSLYSDITNLKSNTSVLSNGTIYLNSEISNIKNDTLNLYNSLTSLTQGGGDDKYLYWKEFNKVSADTFIDYDINKTIDYIEKITYSNYISLRTSNTDKLSFVIQSNIQNDGLTLTQPLDRLGLKVVNNVPLSGEVKSLDLVACGEDAGCDFSNLVVSNIKLYNSNGGYFKNLNLPEFEGYDFNGYTMNTSHGLNITAVNNANNFSNMSNLNFKYICNNTNKIQHFSVLDKCNVTVINNNKLRIDPYINDSTRYTNTFILESMNNKRLQDCTFGNGPIFNYNNNFTFYGLYFNATTWTINNYNQDVLMLDYCNIRRGRIENFGGDNVTFKARYCSQNFQIIDLINFRNVSIQNCKGYTYYDTHYLNIQGVNNFTLNYFTMPSFQIQGTISNNTLSVKGEFTHLNINMSGNQHKFYLTNYTANDLNLSLNNVMCSGLTNKTVNISGNKGGIYGEYTTINDMNITGGIGLNNVNISNLTINLNGLNEDITFQPYNNINLSNMNFVDNNNLYYKGMLKLDNPFNNVFGLNINNQNFNDGINDPNVNLLNSGIIQNINYSITSVNLKMNSNKVINANWICNCDNVSLIDCRGINPNNILFDGENRYLFEDICKGNNNSNVKLTLRVDNSQYANWKTLTANSKIKPFTFDVSQNQIYLYQD